VLAVQRGHLDVRLDNGLNIKAHLAGRMMKNHIACVAQDRVDVAMTAYSLSRGRIIRRK
jgi:translation initiation factor IF-1